MAAFHADQRRDAAVFLSGFDVRCGQCQLQIIRILFDQPVDDINLLDHPLHRFKFRQFRIDPDRPELTADSALAQPA